MNILFAGPWDLVGKTTAEHFLREGHDVCWLTEEPKRTLWDKKLHGTICRGQYKAAQIVPILRSHRIDAVIVLTAGLREGPDAAADVRTEPLGELLTALREYPVRCFAYLSSVELAWQGPLTPRQAVLAGPNCAAAPAGTPTVCPCWWCAWAGCTGGPRRKIWALPGWRCRPSGKDVPCGVLTARKTVWTRWKQGMRRQRSTA